MNRKMMKRDWMRVGIRASMLALCALTVTALPAKAQDNGAPPPPPQPQGQMGPGGHRDPAQMEQRQLEMMTRHLKLTPEQVTQVKAIEDGQRTQMIALRQDTAVPQDQKRSKMMAMRQESEASIRALLTDEQKPKYDEMLAMQKERMAGHHGGVSGGRNTSASVSLKEDSRDRKQGRGAESTSASLF